MKTITGKWQNVDGTPVAGGRVFFKLSQDAVAVGTNQVSTFLIFFTLDGTGAIPAGTQIWANDELSPSNTTYSISVVAAGGGLVWGAENLFVSGASPININNAVPASGPVVVPGAVLLNPGVGALQTIATGDLAITNNLTVGVNLGVTGNQTIGGTLGVTGAVTGLSLALGGGTALATTNRTGTGILVLQTNATLITPVLGVATATTVNGVTIPVTTDTAALLAATQTLAAKRITPRIVTLSTSTTFTPDGDNSDETVMNMTGTAGTITIAAPSGTPVDGQKLILRLKTTNPQTYSFNATYHFSTTVTAPTATAGTKTDYIGCIWNATNSVWDVVAVDQGHS